MAAVFSKSMLSFMFLMSCCLFRLLLAEDDHSQRILDSMTVVNEENFQSVIRENELIIILFYKDDDCMYCAPAAEAISKGRVLILQSVTLMKVNNAKVIEFYGVSNFPTLLYFRHAHPVIYEGLWRAEDVANWVEAVGEISATGLNDETFEHLTQAASGATTGDWLVLFYKAECSAALPVMNTLAFILHQRTNIATVDVETNLRTQKRFKITECPTVIFFRHSKMYHYTVRQYTTRALLNFLDVWYKNEKADRVPLDFTRFDDLTDEIVVWLKLCLEGPYRMAFITAVTAIGSLIAIMLFYCMRRPSEHVPLDREKDE